MANSFYGVTDGPTAAWRQVNVFDSYNTFVGRSSDFSGEGINDILWRRSVFAPTNPGQVAIWQMNGANVVGGGFLPASPSGTPSDWTILFSFGKPSNYIPFGEYSNFSLFPQPKLDFDGNGTSDILWRKQDSSQLAIWNMQGASIINGGFLQGTPSAGNWLFPIPADFNGDGKSDFFWSDFSAAPQKAIWIMDGPKIANGGFLPASPTGTSNGNNWGFEFADFNGDRKTDIFWSNFSGSGEKAIWIMDGPKIANGGFLPSTPISGSDPNSWNAQLADFNGDGKTDIFWNNFTGGSDAIWIMDGPNIANGGFLPASPTGTSSSNEFADFNGDGKTDIFWQNYSGSGEKAIWIMDGPNIANGGFLPLTPISGSDPNSWDTKLADFNGDGKTDIYWNNSAGGKNAIWIMDGPKIVNGGFLQNAPTSEDGWAYEFRDLNGDSKTDIYWTNGISGTKAAWLMDGPNIIGGGFLTQPNPTGEVLSPTI